MVVLPSPILLISLLLSNIEMIAPNGIKNSAMPKSPSSRVRSALTSGNLVIQKENSMLRIKNANPALRNLGLDK